MFDLLRQGVFYNRQIMFRQKNIRDILLDQHRAINAALQARDPEAARAAISGHMSFVRTAFAEDRRARDNEAVARLRLAQEAERG
jgi:GntR family transcriptional regulator, transcriptional repressor for pyruvate dehydrogenase complex